jgi:hypothetical protein
MADTTTTTIRLPERHAFINTRIPSSLLPPEPIHPNADRFTSPVTTKGACKCMHTAGHIAQTREQGHHVRPRHRHSTPSINLQGQREACHVRHAALLLRYALERAMPAQKGAVQKSATTIPNTPPPSSFHRPFLAGPTKTQANTQ